MQFGKKILKYRREKGLTQRELAAEVGVEFSYISKIENGKLDFGDYPSEALIHRLADALDADEFQLLVLAEKIPPEVKERFFERPDAFRAFAALNDKAMDGLVSSPGSGRGTSAKGR